MFYNLLNDSSFNSIELRTSGDIVKEITLKFIGKLLVCIITCIIN
jgi:hypothetical protein